LARAAGCFITAGCSNADVQSAKAQSTALCGTTLPDVAPDFGNGTSASNGTSTTNSSSTPTSNVANANKSGSGLSVSMNIMEKITMTVAGLVSILSFILLA